MRWMTMLFFLLLPFLVRAGTDSGSILLYNDTPFILTAIVQASDGTYLGQFSVQPGQQKNFTTNLGPTQYVRPGTPAVSLTPYTVIWQCPSQGFYSMCKTVSPGSLVKANDCPGAHFCAPKQEQKKEAPASTLKKTK
ncbi:MAG: hypothetical protein A3E80_04330 [Chlamydiae bacterium RIFCSPHIGHO2_12_FULL_49_9]|nr:MAG: hypothetical protein A3E80_04330 [Chlamydiae bacterium RIFCSPHIGHO2_12_FULL_49_9]HLB53028.1 hypothetical protein [Chlamydiales bacterium]